MILAHHLHAGKRDFVCGKKGVVVARRKGILFLLSFSRGGEVGRRRRESWLVLRGSGEARGGKKGLRKAFPATFLPVSFG